MVTETRYKRSELFTLYGWYTNKFLPTQGTNPTSYADGWYDDRTARLGFDIYVLHSNGTRTKISGATPIAVVTRTTDGEGYQSATWNCIPIPLEKSDAIMLNLRTKFEPLTWFGTSQYFTTEPLNADELLPTVWNITYWWSRYYDKILNITFIDYIFGTSAYNSRTENFAYAITIPVLNLIEKAIEKSKAYRQTFDSEINGIKEPLTPKAIRETTYLRIRESINRGCREAVKLLPSTQKRSIAYSILMKACYDIFHYQKTDELMTHYNTLLDKTVGTH